MEFEKKELEKGIDIVKRGTDKNMESILCNTLIKANRDGVSLMGCNNNTAIITNLPEGTYKIDQEEAFLVKPDMLSSFLRQLPGNIDTIKLETGDELELSYGRSRISLEVLNQVKLFPLPKFKPVEEYLKIEGMDFYNLVRGVVWSAQMTETANKTYRCVHIYCKDHELRAEATDGKQIATKTINVDTDVCFDAVIDAKQLNDVADIFKGKDIYINADERNLQLKDNSTTVLMRKLTDQYYDIANIIKHLKPEAKVGINRKELEGVLKRALLLKEANTVIVGLEFDNTTGTLIIQAAEKTKGSIQETLDIFMEGEKIKIYLDAKRLLDILKAIDFINEEKEINICLKDNRNPLMINEESFCYLLLPVNKQ